MRSIRSYDFKALAINVPRMLWHRGWSAILWLMMLVPWLVVCAGLRTALPILDIAVRMEDRAWRRRRERDLA